MFTMPSLLALLDRVAEGVHLVFAHGGADPRFWQHGVPPGAIDTLDQCLFYARAPELEAELRVKWCPYPDPRPPSTEASPRLLGDIVPLGDVLLLLYFRQVGASEELEVRVRHGPQDPWNRLGPSQMRYMRAGDLAFRCGPRDGPLWWDGWRSPPLWIEPGQTSLEATQLTLVLNLLQAQMIELTPEIVRVHRLPLDDGLAMASVLKNFSLPQGWKEPRRYIAKTCWGYRASAAREVAEQHQLLPDGQKDSQRRYTVDEAFRILWAEAANEEKPPSRRTLYNWSKAGKIPASRDARGVTWLDDEALTTVRARMEERQGWKAIKDCLAQQGQQEGNSNPEEAAKKRVYRYRKSGRPFQDIGRAIGTKKRRSNGGLRRPT